MFVDIFNNLNSAVKPKSKTVGNLIGCQREWWNTYNAGSWITAEGKLLVSVSEAVT